jgi:hypothetical protein
VLVRACTRPAGATSGRTGYDGPGHTFAFNASSVRDILAARRRYTVTPGQNFCCQANPHARPQRHNRRNRPAKRARRKYCVNSGSTRAANKHIVGD